jgi:hypothetical protein
MNNTSTSLSIITQRLSDICEAAKDVNVSADERVEFVTEDLRELLRDIEAGVL